MILKQRLAKRRIELSVNSHLSSLCQLAWGAVGAYTRETLLLNSSESLNLTVEKYGEVHRRTHNTEFSTLNSYMANIGGSFIGMGRFFVLLTDNDGHHDQSDDAHDNHHLERKKIILLVSSNI